MAIQAFTDGQPHSTISILDRGLAYGDGLFETMLLRNGQIYLWKYHQRRLTQGLKALSIQIDESLLQAHLKSVHNATLSSKPQIHKLIVTRGEGGKGYCPDTDQSPTFISFISPLNYSMLNKGVKAHICRQKLYANPYLAGLKTLNQLPYVLASQERLHTDFQEGLLFSDKGYLIEATARNVFLVSGNQLLTPLLNDCGVEGVMRKWIIEVIVPTHNLEVIEANVNIERLKFADEVFLCNSIHGIWPLTQCVNEQEEIFNWPLGDKTLLLRAFIHKSLFN